MKKRITIVCVVALLLNLFAIGAGATSAEAMIGTQPFTTVADAVAYAAQNGVTQPIVLNQSVNAITVPENQEVLVDLNGNTVNSANAEGTLFVMDTVSKGMETYGVIKSCSGNVVGAVEENGNRWLMVADENTVTFHYLRMSVANMVCRPADAGMYYQCDFAADATIAGLIKGYGVALSVTGEPTLVNGAFTEDCTTSRFTDFTAGVAGNGGSSTLLKGIMKDTNTYLTNKRNSAMRVYAKTYVELEGGEILLGTGYGFSMQDLFVAAEEFFADYEAPTVSAMVNLYNKYSSVMSAWDIPNLKAAVNGEFEAEEAKVLKILTLGHSLAVDCGHMLNMVVDAEGGVEGYDEVVVGTLYYSGCELWRHVQYMTNNSPEYALYISSSKTPDQPPTTQKNVTMAYAVSYDYWDIVIMQGGVFEIAYDTNYTNGNIQKIQSFVNDRKLNPNATFAWNMTWAGPTDNTLRDKYPYASNPYYTEYAKFDDDRNKMYEAITAAVTNNIVPDETFEFIIPSGTAMQNAWSSYWEDVDVHRDYIHATDLTRVMASYLWYCRLSGIDHLDAINLDVIPKQFFKSTTGSVDRVLTEMEKAIILESVNNALANPLQMTQSQYTEAPAQ